MPTRVSHSCNLGEHWDLWSDGTGTLLKVVNQRPFFKSELPDSTDSASNWKAKIRFAPSAGEIPNEIVLISRYH